MLAKNKIVAFVATNNIEKARPFYQDVLGLTLVAVTQFALEFDAGGTTLRVTEVPDFRPGGGTAVGWEVADIRGEMAELATRGVTFEMFSGMAQDKSGIWTAPGGAQVAWFKDRDGNTLSLTELPKGWGRSP
jgi:catechol 2,3-dioxygenase-like lactoylglutathione lyase family enzyme